MIKRNLNLQEIFSEGWDKTKKNFLFLAYLFIGVVILTFLTDHSDILSFIISIPIGVSLLTIGIIVAQGHTPKYSDIFKSFDSYKITLNYFIASIVYMIIIVVGLLMLIIPGIYLAMRLQFYKFLVIENENINPIESLKESYKRTEGHFWDLFIFTIVIIVMNLIGAIPFGLGLIITIPFTIVATAVLYRRIFLKHS